MIVSSIVKVTSNPSKESRLKCARIVWNLKVWRILLLSFRHVTPWCNISLFLCLVSCDTDHIFEICPQKPLATMSHIVCYRAHFWCELHLHFFISCWQTEFFWTFFPLKIHTAAISSSAAYWDKPLPCAISRVEMQSINLCGQCNFATYQTNSFFQQLTHLLLDRCSFCSCRNMYSYDKMFLGEMKSNSDENVICTISWDICVHDFIRNYFHYCTGNDSWTIAWELLFWHTVPILVCTLTKVDDTILEINQIKFREWFPNNNTVDESFSFSNRSFRRCQY